MQFPKLCFIYSPLWKFKHIDQISLSFLAEQLSLLTWQVLWSLCVTWLILLQHILLSSSREHFQVFPTRAEYRQDHLLALFLMQPKSLLSFDMRMHCWLTFNFISSYPLVALVRLLKDIRNEDCNKNRFYIVMHTNFSWYNYLNFTVFVSVSLKSGKDAEDFMSVIYLHFNPEKYIEKEGKKKKKNKMISENAFLMMIVIFLNIVLPWIITRWECIWCDGFIS